MGLRRGGAQKFDHSAAGLATWGHLVGAGFSGAAEAVANGRGFGEEQHK